MPLGDGTGPLGLGPGTGWGRGPCGRGLRRMWVRGYGRGMVVVSSVSFYHKGG